MSEKLESRPLHDNCLNLVRLLAALQVMYGHVVEHLNINITENIDRTIRFFSGVPIFFVMSGFLLWNSVGKSNNYKTYIKKRFFRIYPELWCGVLVEAIAIIVFYRDKIQLTDFIMFLLGQSTIFQFWTPDSLRGYGCGTPNGSLWTICVLIQFYIIVWFVRRILHNRKISVWFLTMVGCIIISSSLPLIKLHVPLIIYKLYKQTIIPYMFLFLAGAMVAEFYEKIMPFLKKYWFIILGGSILINMLGCDITQASYPVFQSIMLPYALLGFAYIFPKLNIKKDISYGIYLYHMTVVNIMIMLNLTGKYEYMFLAFAVSIILATIFTKLMGKLVFTLKK